MEPITLSIFLFLLLFLGVYLILSSLSGAGLHLQERIRPDESHQETSEDSPWRRLQSRIEKTSRPLGKMVPRSPQELSREARRLVQAGFRRKDAVYVFYGVCVLMAIALLVVSFLSGVFIRNPILSLVVCLAVAIVVPDLWLRYRIRSRKQRIQHGLPDFMDLSVVCVEAGMGLDQAIHRVGREIRSSYPDLSDELNLYALEVNAGRSRSEALRNLGLRSNVEDLRALSTVLVQSARFGTSIAQSLRVFSEDLRSKRRQRAEEAAAKMTVKMIPPLVLFVFPAIFVAVAGPAVIAIIRDLFVSLGGAG